MPTNGLDPEGIRWIRRFLRDLAAEGRTVLVSSHLLAEVQQSVDSLMIITRGHLVYQGGIENVVPQDEIATVVDADDREALRRAIAAAGFESDERRTGLAVRGADAPTVGRIAADAGIALTALQRKGPAFEEVFLELVSGTRVHPSAENGEEKR